MSEIALKIQVIKLENIWAEKQTSKSIPGLPLC